MKVTIKVIEASDIITSENAGDLSFYCTIKHAPSNYLVRSEKFVLDNNTLKMAEENQEFTLSVETSTEPVVFTLYNVNEEEIATLPLNITDFADGKETDKWFVLMPVEGYSDNGKAHIKISVENTEKTAVPNAAPQKAQQPPENADDIADDIAEEDNNEQTDEKKAVKTKEERNREKAALLQIEYDPIYENAKNDADARYQQILAENAAILIENESWVKDNEKSNNAPNEPNVRGTEPALESSDSDL